MNIFISTWRSTNNTSALRPNVLQAPKSVLPRRLAQLASPPNFALRGLQQPLNITHLRWQLPPYHFEVQYLNLVLIILNGLDGLNLQQNKYGYIEKRTWHTSLSRKIVILLCSRVSTIDVIYYYIIWTDSRSMLPEANIQRQEGKYLLIKVLQGCIHRRR